MYCSTCGARVPDGRASCPACGAAVQPRMQQVQQPLVIPNAAMGGPATAGTLLEPVGICPRCGFRGQSVGYFSRGGHVAALVLLAVATSTFVGAGGILYYVLRRDHRICPRCGEGWGKHGAFALTAGPNGVVAPRGLPQQGDDLALPGGGGGKRGFGMAMMIFAAFMLMVGIANFEFAPIIISLFAGGGGFLLRRSANLEREQRREALLERLQLPVLQLAAKRGGRLTVTDVSTEFGWPINRAEKVLNSLEDGLRVMSDITDEGVIVYDFLEIRAAQLPPQAGGPPRPSLPADGGPQPSLPA